MQIKYKSLEGKTHLLTEHQFELVHFLDKYAIEPHKIINLNYESDSGKYWRKVEPYLIGIDLKAKKNIFFTGYFIPTKKQLGEGKMPGQKRYLIDKIEIKEVKILDEKFYKLQVASEKIYSTPNIVVLTRVNL